MKNIFKISKSSFSIVLSVLASIFLVSVAVIAASTIDLNISTGGNLTVSGTSATSTFSTGGLTVGTSQFVILQTSGKIGIGTTSPFNLLHVYSSTSPTIRVESGSLVTEPSIIIKGPSGISSPISLHLLEGSGTGPSPNGSWELGYLASADYFYIAGGNSPIEKVVITDQGRMGIGTTSPSVELAVSGSFFVTGNQSASGTLTVSGTSTLAGISSGFINSSNNIQSVGILTVSGSGSSTFAGGLSVTGGSIYEQGARVCTSANGVCSIGGGGTINSGTANTISFYPTSGTTVDDAPFLVVSTTTNRLGIGTSTPIAKLSVEQESGDDPVFVVSDSGTSTPHLWIDGTGYIGAGTNAPNSVGGLFNLAGRNFNVYDPSNAANILAVGGNTASLVLGNTAGAANNKIMQLINYSDITYFRSLTDGGAIQADHIIVMKPSTGYVGIGTSSPWGRLSVTAAGAASGIGFVFADSGNTPKFVIKDDGKVGIGTTTPLELLEVMGTSTTINLKVTNAVGVGTTSPAKTVGIEGDIYQNSSATTTFYIKSSAAGRGGCIEMESPGDAVYRIFIDQAGPSIKVELGTCK